MLIELFGYLGSALVVVSMLMSSVVKLRVINVIGSVISGTYALIIGSFPLALMNGALIVINLWNLRKLLLTTQQYALIPCSREDGFLKFFLEHYREDIRLYFPEFREDLAEDRVYLVSCNGDSAGIFLGHDRGDGSVEVTLEYTTPAYRDCSIGKFLYSALPKEGVKLLKVGKSSAGHAGYLRKMGYQEDQGRFTKAL